MTDCQIHNSGKLKESGVEWLPEIPVHWSHSKLGLYAKRVVVGIAEAATQAYEDSGTPILRATNIRPMKIIGDYLYLNSNFADERESKSLHAGDLVTVRTGNAGVTALIPKELEGCQCFTMLITTLNSKLNSEFMNYWMNSSPAQSYFSIEGWGTAQVNISVPILKQLPIPIPPILEQRDIVRYLDAKTVKIDELIQKQEKLIDLYNERINTIVLNGLGESRAQYMRLMHASDVISRPVAQENDGSYKPLGLYNRGRGIFIKEERGTDDMGDSDFFWVKSGDLIFSGQFAWEGAVAMAQNEHDGCVVSHRYPVLRGKDGVALTEYLLALFLTSHGDFLLNENSRGAAGRNRPLNISLLLKEKIPIIAMDSQLKIKTLIYSKERFLKKSAQEITLLKEHRASLIAAAVTGKIDVKDQINGN